MLTPEKPVITKPFLKKVADDWNRCFPNLTLDNEFGLSRIVGPLLIYVGFDVISKNEEYYPQFGVHNLARRESYLTCMLSRPLRILQPKAASWLSLEGHDEGHYISLAEQMKKMAHLPLQGTVSVSMVFEAYKKYVARNIDFYLIDQFQDPALIAAWSGQLEKADECLEWGFGEFLKWEEEAQKKYGGRDGWYTKMQQRIHDSEMLQRIVEEEIAKHGLTHIPREELSFS
jgi:hypothetical protein